MSILSLFLTQYENKIAFVRRSHCAIFLLWILLLLVLFGCSRQTSSIKTVTGLAMGTAFTVKWVSHKSIDDTHFASAINKEIGAVENSMSTYLDASDLSGLNGAPVGVWYDIPYNLAALIVQAQHIGDQTHGAFDITIGAAVNAWGFGPRGKPATIPDEQQRQRLRDLVNHKHITVDVQQSRIKKLAQTYIDLSAIAKGYGVDKVAQWLDKQGIKNYLVEIGGELKAKGSKPESNPWRIAIESPVTDQRDIFKIVRIADSAIATSGNYRNYYEEAGVRYSHTLDPATLAPVTHQLASVTVMTDSAAEADALATALMVMGEVKGPQWAKQHSIPAYFIYRSGSDYEAQAVAGFEKFIIP